MNTLPADGSAAKKIKTTAACFMGLSHILYLKDYVKGIFFAAIETVFLCFLPVTIKKLIELVTLGSPQPDLPIKQRDNSIFMLIDGILFIAIIAIFVVAYILSVKGAQKDYKEYCRTRRLKNQKQNLENALGNAFPIVGLAPAFLMIVIFVVVPLLFSVCVAFTNYSAPDHITPNNTVDWVGFQNFKDLMVGDETWPIVFARVAVWTLIWAVMATVTCYFGGLLIAVLLKESKIKIAPFFRVIFILPYAVPSVVSMLVWKNLLNGTFGTVNRTLMALGLMQNPIQWLGEARLAQVMVIVINLWAGFGYFMLLTMGTMTAISQDMYEAATIDGANKLQVLGKITLPLVLYQTLPLIIMSFTHNINNFGAIFFLTGGQPVVADSTISLAGGTELLVTWIYKLTITLQKYNYASVIAVMIFIVLAPFAIFNFRQTKAYKEGEV